MMDGGGGEKENQTYYFREKGEKEFGARCCKWRLPNRAIITGALEPN